MNKVSVQSFLYCFKFSITVVFYSLKQNFEVNNIAIKKEASRKFRSDRFVCGIEFPKRMNHFSFFVCFKGKYIGESS